MILRNGVRPHKVTTVFFHAATVFMIIFVVFMISAFVASDRLGEPWSGIGALSLVGFILCCMIYTASNLVDRRRAKRKTAK